jgi:1,2-dihydroxy-3-keto-5-methylthiopentene dioxygenase
MSYLKIFPDHNPVVPIFQSNDYQAIAAKLKEKGVRFEHWEINNQLASGVSEEEVVKAYQTDIDRLIAAEGYQAVDVVSLNRDHPEKAKLRQKFLAEHTHSEDEVRFFVAGVGLFSLHLEQQVFELLCTQGDLISVPKGTPHWFDMGANPNFIAIRLFNNPEGWVAQYTGSDLASKFSRLEN